VIFEHFSQADLNEKVEILVSKDTGPSKILEMLVEGMGLFFNEGHDVLV
jgi:hypothetical protein